MLEDIYERAIDWVKYAEAKNAALIALNGALIVGISFLKSSEGKALSSAFIHLEPILLLILLLGCLSSLISFIPILSRLKIRKQDLPNPNLFYFGDIARISIDKFLTVAVSKYEWKIENKQQFKDLSTQIIINSEIAIRKFFLFKVAAYLDLLFFLILFFFCSAKIIYG